MTSAEIAALVDRLAHTLREVDAVLADTRPGEPGQDPGGAGPTSLEALCSELAADVEAVSHALNAIGTAAPDSPHDRIGARVQQLARTYRRIAHASLRAGRPPLHERLADCARDNLVIVAHLLAQTIDGSVALLRQVAASGPGGTAAFDAQLSAPDNIQELAAFTPQRLAYASHAVRSALDAAATCRAVATDANAPVPRLAAAQVAQPAVSVREPSAQRRPQGLLSWIWSMLGLIGLGMLVHDVLDDECDQGGPS